MSKNKISSLLETTIKLAKDFVAIDYVMQMNTLNSIEKRFNELKKESEKDNEKINN